MKIAVYGKTFNQGFRPYITRITWMFWQNIKRNWLFISLSTILFVVKPARNIRYTRYLTDFDDFDTSCDLMVSIGGDGTFLESIPFVIHHRYPDHRY